MRLRGLVLVGLLCSVAWGGYYDVVTGQANGVSYYTSALSGAALLDTVGSYDGTVTGCDQLSTDTIIGEYMQFIRADLDEVDAGRQTAWEAATAMTWTCWVRFTAGVMADGANNYAIVGKGSGSSNFCGIVKTFGGGPKLRTFIKNNTNYADVDLTGFSDSTWYHVAVVYNGAAAAPDRVKAYIDAAPKTVTITGTIQTALENSTASVSIGHLSWVATFNFNGDIDEAATWNRALDSAEIAAQYNAATPAPPSPELTVNNTYARTVLQRDSAATSKIITVSGTYTETIDSVQVAIWDSAADTARVGWTLLDGAPSEGVYSGTVVVPWGYWYLLKVRGFFSGLPFDTITAAGKWGVGVRYGGPFGQSNVGYVPTGEYTVAKEGVVMFDTSWTYKPLVDPIGYAGGGSGTWGASMAPALGNAVVDSTSIPICFVPYALPSSGMYNSVWDSGGTAFRAAEARMDSIGDVEGEILVHSETDAFNGVTGANYYTALKRYVNQRSIDHGNDYHIILVQMARRMAGFGPSESDAVHAGIRAAKMRVAEEHDNVYIGPNGMAAQDDGGGMHWIKGSQDTLGMQVALAIRHRLGLASYYRGPRVSGAQFVDSDSKSVDVTFTHSGTVIAPADSVRGFYGHKVSDSAWIEATTQTLTDNVLRLSFDVAVDSVYPLYGMNPTGTVKGNPVTTIIRDDSPFLLPLETTNGGIAILDIPPTITAQSVDAYASVGDTATLWIATTGTNLSFQWFSTDGPIAGATNDTLKLFSDTVLPVNAYVCSVYNVIAYENSTPMLAAIDYPPVITRQPINDTVVAPGAATFSVSVTGENLFTRWQDSTEAGWVDIDTAIDTIYTTGELTINDGKPYRFHATNFYGTDTSASALAVMHWLPVISATSDSASPSGNDSIQVRGQNFYTNPIVTVDGDTVENLAFGTTEMYDSLWFLAPAHRADSVEVILITQYGGADTMGLLYYDSATVQVLATYKTGFKVVIDNCRDTMKFHVGDGVNPVSRDTLASAYPETLTISGVCYGKTLYYQAMALNGKGDADSITTLDRDPERLLRWYPDSAFRTSFPLVSPDSCFKPYRGTLTSAACSSFTFNVGGDTTAAELTTAEGRLYQRGATGQWLKFFPASEMDFGTDSIMQVRVYADEIMPALREIRRVP